MLIINRFRYHNTITSKNLMFNYIFKRTMHRYNSMIKHITPMGNFRGYATNAAFKLKHRAAKDFANDGTGSHPHVGKQLCVLAVCDSKECLTVCNQPTTLSILGHNTHKPPIGRMARFISNEDAYGNPKAQYFVPVNKKSEMTEQEKQQYGKDFKPDTITKAFVDNHADKYE